MLMGMFLHYRSSRVVFTFCTAVSANQFCVICNGFFKKGEDISVTSVGVFQC